MSPKNRGRLMRSRERFEWVVGAISLVGIVAPELALNEPRFHFKGATIAPRSGHDRAGIRPRSCVDRDLDSQTIAVRFSWNDRDIDSAMKESRSRLDRTAITVRLYHNRGFLP